MKWIGTSEVLGGMLLFLIGLVIFVGLKGCASIGAPDGYRYRLTVYAGDQAFSTVTDVKYSSDFSPEGFRKQHTYLSDRDAIQIALPGHEFTFALPTYESPPDVIAAELAARRARKPDHDQREALKPSALQSEQDLPRQLFRRDPTDSPYRRDDIVRIGPIFVTFDDPSNPASRREVSPESLGVRRVTVQLTRDPADRTIFKRFPTLDRALSPQSPDFLAGSILP